MASTKAIGHEKPQKKIDKMASVVGARFSVKGLTSTCDKSVSKRHYEFFESCTRIGDAPVASKLESPLAEMKKDCFRKALPISGPPQPARKLRTGIVRYAITVVGECQNCPVLLKNRAQVLQLGPPLVEELDPGKMRERDTLVKFRIAKWVKLFDAGLIADEVILVPFRPLLTAVRPENVMTSARPVGAGFLYAIPHGRAFKAEASASCLP
jgi:hypothetical protein